MLRCITTLKSSYFPVKTFLPVLQAAARRICSIQYYQLHNCIIEFTNILYYLTDWNWKWLVNNCLCRFFTTVYYLYLVLFCWGTNFKKEPLLKCVIVFSLVKWTKRSLISVVSSLIRKLRLLSFQFRGAWITFRGRLPDFLVFSAKTSRDGEVSNLGSELLMQIMHIECTAS